MSADNWGECPKCSKIKAENLAKAYGKVPASEYQKLLDKSKEEKNTLREDYEIWTRLSGVFSVSYSCSCSDCNFEFSYKHEETIPFTLPTSKSK